MIGRYPVDRENPLAGELAAALVRLRTKLLKLETTHLGISDYSRAYLEGTLVNGISKLNLYAYLLLLALGDTGDLAHRQFVDYGGGNGLLAALAREAGVGTVVYTDIDQGSAADARTIAAALGVEADSYLVGETEILPPVVADGRWAVASYDVIEHVYDVWGYLGALVALPAPRLDLVIASGANGANPRLRRNLMRAQRTIERTDREASFGHKTRDTTRAYRLVRADIIRELAPALTPDTVDWLADRTRGLAGSDLDAAVRMFAASATEPPPPTHPTNTCDPRTGNWAEHLLSPNQLARSLRGAGFSATVRPGYYNPYLGRKGAIAGVLNRAVAAAGPVALTLAPYYIIDAHRLG